MTAPVDDQCLERQPRERAVACWCGCSTWALSALCDRHDIAISDTTPTASAAGPSNPAGRHVTPYVPADIAP